jgi:iron complex transport system ATP-binding protein
MSALLLQAEGATVRLPGGAVIGPFTLDLQAGERVAVLGPSGAGKSTLLKLLAGEWPEHAGCVRFDGRRLREIGSAERATRRAVLPQAHGVAFGLPVALVVALGRFAREPDPQRDTIVGHALREAQAQHLAGRRFDTLSGGEQARVMLARVFAQAWDSERGLLLVDEPLAALDPALQLELTAALCRFCAARGQALVAILHDINQALAAFGRLWLVRGGRLVGDVPVGAAALPALAALFGVALHRVDGGDGTLAVLVRPAAGAAVAAASAASAVAA